MENFPFRGERSEATTDRKPAERVSANPVIEEPTAMHRPVSPRPGTRRQPVQGKKKLVTFLLAIATLGVIGFGINWFITQAGIPSYINTSKYQVACLQSGECYFGKVTSVKSDVIIIKDVFYVQKSTQTSTTQASDVNNNLELVKLGNEVHGPEDMMVINRSQVLYVENLKSDGKVVENINKYHSQNKN